MTFTKVAWVVWGVFILYWAVSARLSPSPAERREALSARLVYLSLLVVGIALLVFDPPFYGPLLWRFIPDEIGANLIGLAILLEVVPSSVEFELRGGSSSPERELSRYGRPGKSNWRNPCHRPTSGPALRSDAADLAVSFTSFLLS